MRINVKNKKGQSLIEIIIAVALLAIVGTPVVIGVINASKVVVDSKDLTNANIIGEEVSESVQNGELIDGVSTQDLNGRRYTITVTEVLANQEEINTASFQEEEGIKNYWQITQNGQVITAQQYINGIPVGFVRQAGTTEKNILEVGFSVVFFDNKIRLFVDAGELAEEDNILNINVGTENVKFIINNTSIPIINLYNVMTKNKIENVFFDPSISADQKSKLNINFDKNILLADAKDLLKTLDPQYLTKRDYKVEIENEVGDVLFKRPADVGDKPITNISNIAFTEKWNSQLYSAGSTNLISDIGGILKLKSTSVDPMIFMYNLGSFDPNVYKYVKVRYRIPLKDDGTQQAATKFQIFFTNSTYTTVYTEDQGLISNNLIPDGNWHVYSMDMRNNPRYLTGGNITGWRYDWAAANDVTMDLDYIRLSAE